MKAINYSIGVFRMDTVYSLVAVFTSDMVLHELWLSSYAPIPFRGEL